ncbi:hypothetical protein [Spiroplasma endosymbiont of Labia minor]|uniref:hypothetical protein n=1 Tax=Spiroplasma endosymbiont of Labia minor TaxID=3066305 RepID=UPI0030CC2F33
MKLKIDKKAKQNNINTSKSKFGVFHNKDVNKDDTVEIKADTLSEFHDNSIIIEQTKSDENSKTQDIVKLAVGSKLPKKNKKSPLLFKIIFSTVILLLIISLIVVFAVGGVI